MTKKQQKSKKQKSIKKVKFNLEKTTSPSKKSKEEMESETIQTSNIKSILKVKTTKEQLKSVKCKCGGNISADNIAFSKNCELALERFFNDNIDLFLHFFKKYDLKQKELEEENDVENDIDDSEKN